MLKPLVILAMLTAPALADPAIQPIKLEFQVKTAQSARTNVLSLVDNACGRVEDRTPDHTDEIKACAHADGANVRLEIDWSSHTDTTAYKNQSTIVLAHGATVEVGKPEARLIVRMP